MSEPTPTDTTRPEPSVRPPRRKPRFVLALVAALLLIPVVMAGWYALRVNQAVSAIPRVDYDKVTVTPTGLDTRPPGTLKNQDASPAPTARAAGASGGASGPAPTAGSGAATGTGAGSGTGAPAAGPGTSGAGTGTGGGTGASAGTGAGSGSTGTASRSPRKRPTSRTELPAPAMPAKQSTPEPERPAVAPESTGINFLLLGTDFADGGVSRSDSFMVVHVNSDRRKMYVISYPRDSYVAIPGYGKGKINWAYQWGGTALAKKTIEQLSGIGIDHTLHVDFDGFIALTNSVGGVTVDNPDAFTNLGYDFPAGPVTVSGEKALAYVRARYHLPRWDLSRAANQRRVVKAIIVKSLRPEVLGNPATFDRLLTDASASVEVSSGLTDGVVRDLALSMRLDSSDDIVLMQAPISGFDELSDGDEITLVDEAKNDALSAAIRNDSLADYVAQYGTKGYDF